MGVGTRGIVRVMVMKEKELEKRIKDRLEKSLKGYEVKTGESLIYKIILDRNLEHRPNDLKNPTRGDYAFQTDILIKKSGLPLVVIELKNKGFSTHDIITYSNKAIRHKDIYPYIRYGYVVFGVPKIDKKFFTHNVGVDFALAVENLEDIQDIEREIKAQLSYANQLLKILDKEGTIKKFVTSVRIK
jgi:hypothetical protein